MSRALALLLAISVLPVVDAVAQSALTVGTVLQTQRDCSAVQAGTSRVLDADGPVYFQDLLRTGPGARLASRLADGSELTLGENASILVDEFVYAPDIGGGRLDLQVLQGSFLFVGGKLDADRDARVTIGTRVGTLGIRGTRVWGGMIDGAFGVLVLDGRVTVTNDGGEVALSAGQGTMISGPDSAPGKPKNWPQAKIDRAVRTVSFGVD